MNLPGGKQKFRISMGHLYKKYGLMWQCHFFLKFQIPYCKLYISSISNPNHESMHFLLKPNPFNSAHTKLNSYDPVSSTRMPLIRTLIAIKPQQSPIHAYWVSSMFSCRQPSLYGSKLSGHLSTMSIPCQPDYSFGLDPLVLSPTSNPHRWTPGWTLLHQMGPHWHGTPGGRSKLPVQAM